MTITLSREQLNTFQIKNKIYTYLSSLFTKAFFKVTSNTFTILLRGQTGVIQTEIPCTLSSKDSNVNPIYYSVDFSKWQTALQKFDIVSSINLTFQKNLLKISSEECSDVINLGVVYYKDDSGEALVLNSFINTKRSEMLSKKHIELNEDIIESLTLADSLFTAQASSAINSVGLGMYDIMYADRSVVLKILLNEALPSELFEDLVNEDHIFIHSYLIKLLSLVYRFDNNTYFTPDYSTFYWEDDNTSILLISEDRKVALPSTEEFEGIKPSDSTSGFEVLPSTLKNGLNFFTGFYDGSVWKPLTFKAVVNKEVDLYYRHPTTEITKILNDTISTSNGEFTIDSETLRKIVSKICDKFPKDDVLIKFNFDEEAPGIYMEVPGLYEVVLSKLED